MYDTSPDLSNSIWATCSVIFASIGTFSIISNLAIVVIYMRKPSVSKSEILLTIIQVNFVVVVFSHYKHSVKCKEALGECKEAIGFYDNT